MNLSPNFVDHLAPREAGMLAPEVRMRTDEDDKHFAPFWKALYAAGAPGDPRVQQAKNALAANDTVLAARLLSKVLAKNSRDAAALNVKAELAKRASRPEEAKKLLAKCIEIAPDCALYRYNYAVVLSRPGTGEQALAQLDELIRRDPGNLLFRAKKADLLQKEDKYTEAAECYRHLAEDFPEVGDVQSGYAHIL